MQFFFLGRGASLSAKFSREVSVKSTIELPKAPVRSLMVQVDPHFSYDSDFVLLVLS